ncbi:MAG: dienelactone hydrolase family protein [Pseudomonadota bacterium]
MPQSHIEVEFDDGALDAFVACPEGTGRRPPILLFGDRGRLTDAVRAQAARLSAHNFFVLAPDLGGRPADARRDAAWACVDHLADDPRVDDVRVAAVGFGSGADLAIDLAAARAERIAVAAAYGGRGFGPRASAEISHKINGFVRLGYPLGTSSPRVGLLEAALGIAGVLFDTEVYGGEPDLTDLVDLLDRTLRSPETVRSGAAENRLGPG